MTIHPLPGTMIPVTAFVQASAYRSPAEAMTAYRDARRAFDEAEQRFAPLREEARRLRGYDRDRWELEADYWPAAVQWEDARDHLASVERAIGIFHPVNRDRLEAFVEGAIELLDFADGDPDAEDDDPAEEDDPSGVNDEDGCNTATQAGYLGLSYGHGPGCELSDPGEASALDLRKVAGEPLTLRQHHGGRYE